MKNQGNNCNVLGTSADEATHVTRLAPITTKRKEMMQDPKYVTNLNDGFDVERQKATTRARRDGNTRPLGGGAAKK
jgi:hypothetical protein